MSRKNPECWKSTLDSPVSLPELVKHLNELEVAQMPDLLLYSPPVINGPTVSSDTE